MSDLSDDPLLREIEEDLRRDRLEQLWKRYGTWVITLAVIFVLAVAGREMWRWYERREANDASTRYIAAIEVAASDPKAAQEALRTLADKGPKGYALLARLREAGLYMQQGNAQAAAAIYSEVEDAAPRPAFRDLAVILGGYASLAANLTAEQATQWQKKLTPLAADTSPWRFSARELLAIITLQSGNNGKAKELFAQLADDAKAPADIRERAKMIVGQLGES
jgi:hypothetical protein